MFILNAIKLTIAFTVCTAIFPALSEAKTQVYYAFPAKYLPANPTQHPRIYIQNRLPELQALYNTAPTLPAVAAFKHDVIDKLMKDGAVGSDLGINNWHDKGWAAAALSLQWLITGNAASGQKACDVFIPYFDGNSTNKPSYQTSLYYALAYDWLYNHPCFTETMKADLRAKLVSWSDGLAQRDEAISWTAHDSDANISATSAHFISGLAILGEDNTNGLKLLKRGWTGWKYGLNANDTLPDFPISKFFSSSLETGVPLPGWDYGMMSDLHIGQNLFYVLDELGVINAEFPQLKKWWANSLTYFMHSVDPANTHWRWIGDQQSNVDLSQYTGYLWSYLSNCIYLSERYGYTTQAALGRSFLDNLHHPSYGIADGDTMLWFMHSYPSSAKRVDFTSTKRYILGGFGTTQHMGIGMFRSDWTGGSSYSEPKQVTWGGFYGIGSYPVDHMHNSAGSFWLWRNGEYLLTEPWNYGGNEVATYPFTLWNSLAIPNEAVTSEKRQPDNGGPVVYFNQDTAYLERGLADDKKKIFYALLNGDKNYNLPENIWATCSATCRQPVAHYTRSFVYDGNSGIIFLVDKVDLARSRPVGLRFRTQNSSILSTKINYDTVKVPSDKGNYRTLIRVLTPTLSAPWDIAAEPWANIANWQIAKAMMGSQVHKTFPTALQHRLVTVLQSGLTTSSNTALNKAGLITSTSGSLGGCAASFCFVTSSENAIFRSSVSYTTPATMPAKSRHLVTDLIANACYAVTSSVSGSINSHLSVNAKDKSLLFTSPIAGSQTITINPC